MEAIIIFWAILLPYILLVNRMNDSKNLFIKRYIKNNLGIFNAISALCLLVFYIMHFGDVFKPTSQILFNAPALFGSILLGLVSYLGLKNRLNYYSKKIKFWKKSFWRKLFNKSPRRFITKFLPKTGLVLILVGFAFKIMKANLLPVYQSIEITTLYQTLIISGAILLLFAGLIILRIMLIFVSMGITGKTFEETERDIFFCDSNNSNNPATNLNNWPA